jgi:quinoprotein glucose dehydrogenase
MAALRNDGMFTPPSEQGSLMYPGNAGGSNWGGIAVDPERRIVVANVQDFAWVVTLFPGEDWERERAANPGVEISPQWGTPFAMRREVLTSPLGVPCNPPPWGTLAAVHLDRGEILWQIPFGTPRSLLPIPIDYEIGTPSLGGPLVTASGLIFIAATLDGYLRAYDTATGEERWRTLLPAGGQATPMTYRLRPDSRQYVVIAAGGYGRAPTVMGDSLVAFALP